MYGIIKLARRGVIPTRGAVAELGAQQLRKEVIVDPRLEEIGTATCFRAVTMRRNWPQLRLRC
jgi:hypothetical protein